MAALLWSEWQQQQQQTFVLYITIQQPLLERILVWRHGKRGEWRGGCRGPLQSSLTDGAVPPPIFEPCTQFDLNSVDARTPCHVAGGCGGRNRLSPVGGAANGIPLYLCRDTETSLKNVVSTTRQSCTTAKRRASTVSADAIFIYIRIHCTSTYSITAAWMSLCIPRTLPTTAPCFVITRSGGNGGDGPNDCTKTTKAKSIILAAEEEEES